MSLSISSFLFFVAPIMFIYIRFNGPIRVLAYLLTTSERASFLFFSDFLDEFRGDFIHENSVVSFSRTRGVRPSDGVTESVCFQITHPPTSFTAIYQNSLKL